MCVSDGSRETLPGKMASLEVALQETREDPSYDSRPHGKPAFLSSAAPTPSLQQCIPTSPPAGSAPALGVLAQGLDPIPPGPNEHIPSINCSAGPVWGEARTKAPWVGAAFPVDDLQLLLASSPSRWIILPCRVCNYRLCHLAGWGTGADGRMFILRVPPAGCLGQRGGRRQRSGESSDGCVQRGGNVPPGRELIGRKPSPNRPPCCKGRTSRCCRRCQLGKDKDAVAGWEEERVWPRDGGRDGQ